MPTQLTDRRKQNSDREQLGQQKSQLNSSDMNIQKQDTPEKTDHNFNVSTV